MANSAVGPVGIGLLHGASLILVAGFLFGGGGHGVIILPISVLASPFTAVSPALAVAALGQWGFFGYLVSSGLRGRRWAAAFLIAHYLGLPVAFTWVVRTPQGAEELRMMIADWPGSKPDLIRLGGLYLFGQVVAWLAVLRPPSGWDARKGSDPPSL